MRKRHRYTVFLAGAAVAALAIVPVAIGDGQAGSAPLRRRRLHAAEPARGGPVARLFGINPGGKPWVANRHSSIRVKRNGDARIKVFGLVIPGNTPPNPLHGRARGEPGLQRHGGRHLGPVPFSPDGDAMFRRQASWFRSPAWRP